VLARTLAQTFELLELDDHQVCKFREVERVEREVWFNARELAQGDGFEFEGAPLLAWR
jgi:hypothetical protein